MSKVISVIGGYDHVSIVPATTRKQNVSIEPLLVDAGICNMSPLANKKLDSAEPEHNVSNQGFRKIRKTFSFPEEEVRGDQRREDRKHQTAKRPVLQRRSSVFSTLQAVSDGVLVFLLASLTAYLKFGFFPKEYLGLCIALLFSMGIVYDRMGVYRNFSTIRQKAHLILKAWSVSFGILLSIGFLLKITEFFSRQYLLTLFVSGYSLQLLAHIVWYNIALRMTAARESKPALIIGSGQLAGYLHDKINQNPWLPEKVVGLVKADKEYAEFLTSQIDEDRTSPPVIGNLDDVLQIVRDMDIRIVYFAVPLDSSPIIEKLYLNLLDRNVDVHWAPNIFGLNLVNYSVKELSGIPIITLSESPMIGINLIVKNIEDRVLALLGLLLVSPILLLAAIAIKLDSRGPVFFRQDRTGWDGKNFKILKFRTMKVQESGSGFVRQATRNDPRITRVGKFLRRTSIDELPQLFNVLEGTMSLVGPRPHAVSHNVTYSARIEAYLARHRIKPGITGLAQIRGYRGETKDLTEMIKRVESDLEYINNWSLWLDLKIMFLTIFSLKHEKAY